MAEDSDKLEKRRAANRASYQRNREKQLAKKKEWREKNADRMKELNARWYRENKEKADARNKKWREANRDRMRTYFNAWYRANKDRARAYKQANRHKIAAQQRKYRGFECSVERYSELASAQNGLCAICGTLPSNKRGLYVDHCHVTGTVRALLCHRCNVMIGMARDDIAVMEAGIAYLKKHRPIIAADREEGKET